MTVSAKWYGKAFLAAFNKEIDWAADDIRMALTTDSYTPDQDAHDYFDDITNEVEGAGYTANGTALASLAITYNSTSDVIKLDADDATWGSSTITARYAIIYDYESAADATSPLMVYIDFGEDKASSGGDFTISFASTGIATVTVS